MVTRNQIKENLKLQTGLHLYKSGQSKFWYVRILIPRTKKFLRKSTAQTNRIDATKVAYELFQDFMTQPTKYTKIDAPNSFKFYVEKLIEKQRREVKTEHRPFFRTVSLLTLRGHFPSHIFKSLHRCLVANTGMPALSVVEDLDVFEDCSLGLSAGSEPLTVHQLLFQ